MFVQQELDLKIAKNKHSLESKLLYVHPFNLGFILPLPTSKAVKCQQNLANKPILNFQNKCTGRCHEN